MSHQMIEVFVSDDGDTVIVEAHGYEGQTCKSATSDIEKALGISGTPVYKPSWLKRLVKSHPQAVKR